MSTNQLRDRLRADKLRKLAASTSFAAEAETACRLADGIEAALPRPSIGSPEYFAQWRKFSEKIGHLHCRLGSNIFNREDIRLIKNLRRYGAKPWDLDAETLQRVETLSARIRETT